MRTLLFFMLVGALAGCGKLTEKLKGKEATPAGPPSPGPPRGTPFVLGGPHAVKDAVWSPSGDLIGASETELYVVTPGPAAVRRIEVAGGISRLRGKSGARGFFIEQLGTLTLWDAKLLAPKKRLEGFFDFLAMSDDGTRAALFRREGTNGHAVVVDTGSGDVVATIEGPDDHAPDVVLSPDGRYAIVTAKDIRIDDLTTKQTILRRGRRTTHPDIADSFLTYRYWSFRDDRLVLESDRGLELIALPSGDVVAPTEPLALDQSEARGPAFKRFAVERDCAIVDRATRKKLSTHTAPCDLQLRYTTQASYRADERYFGAAFRGGLVAIDLPSGAVSGLGDLTAFPPHRAVPLAVEGDQLLIAAPKPVWVTNKSPPELAAITRKSNTLVEHTSTHRFAIDDEGGKYTLRAWDKAGNEVLAAPIGENAMTIRASDNVAWVERAADYLRCEVGKGCAAVKVGGVIQSVDGPWIVVAPPYKHGEPHLANTVTQETRPIPKACVHLSATDVFVLRDGPQVLCGGANEVRLAIDASLKESTIAIPGEARDSARLLGRAGDHVYFGPSYFSTNAVRAYRYDLATHETVALFVSADGGAAMFPDGKVETFGDDASSGILRCLDHDQLLPWSSCRSAFEVSGRL